MNAEDGNSFPEDDTKNAIHVSISEQDFKILSFVKSYPLMTNHWTHGKN
jgi:hypothetical protein